MEQSNGRYSRSHGNRGSLGPQPSIPAVASVPSASNLPFFPPTSLPPLITPCPHPLHAPSPTRPGRSPAKPAVRQRVFPINAWARPWVSCTRGITYPPPVSTPNRPIKLPQLIHNSLTSQFSYHLNNFLERENKRVWEWKMEGSVATELRLGLPGREESEVKISNKRSCSEMDDSCGKGEQSESEVAPATK